MTATWSKAKDGGWLVRGEAGAEAGRVLTVTRKDGSTSKETVESVVWIGDGVSLYAGGFDDLRDSVRRTDVDETTARRMLQVDCPVCTDTHRRKRGKGA